MGDQFIPYNEALWLKVLGFDEQCMRFYSSKMGGTLVLPERMSNMHNTVNSSVEFLGYCAAPLWQQAFDWFREKYGLNALISPYYDECFYPRIEESNSPHKYDKDTIRIPGSFYYYGAREALLDKLIEIAKEENDR